MDFKRNFSSNIQPPTQIKSNHIVNPIAGISNASTPVRTRIIKPGSQLNSTPVNVHKIGVPAKTPTILNKQNDSGNAKFGLKKPKLPQQNLNLSPVMALNRKMSEGPQLQIQQRSITPNSFKRQQSLSNIMDRKDSVKNQQGFGQALQQSRRSNGLNGMIESRAKTPTRIAFAQVFQKQSNQFNSTGGLRTSGSAQALLQGITTAKLRDSRNVKLIESRSFQQLITLGTPVAKDDEVLCTNSNQHQKKVKAKYKVVQQPQDQQLLVYCSKCAINLVQKGFKVQDLTPQDIHKIKQYKNKNQLTQQNSNEYFDYAHETNRKLQLKLKQLRNYKDNFISAYQKQIDDVDCYYNSIISLVQQLKIKDKQIIQRNLEKQRINGDKLQKKLNDGIHQLNYLLRNGRIGQQHLDSIQQLEMMLVEKGYGYRFDGSKCLIDKIQQKFNHFSQIFQNQGRLRIQQDNQLHHRPQKPLLVHQVKQNTDALRFSFEKNTKQTRKSPLGYRKGAMNPLQQAPESMQGQDSGELQQKNQKKAFRTLFPEDDQQYIQQTGDRQQSIHSPTFKQI